MGKLNRKSRGGHGGTLGYIEAADQLHLAG